MDLAGRPGLQHIGKATMTDPQRGADGGTSDPSPPTISDLPVIGDVCADILSHMLNGVAYCRMLFKDGKADDFVYLHTNPAFHAQTGLGNVVGKRVTEVIPGIRESDPTLFEIYGRVASGGHSEKFQTYVVGLQQWFEVEVFSPHAAHFVAIFNVITTRKLREEALQQAQERLEIAQRASRSGIWDWNIVTGRIVWSDELFRLFGVDQATATASFESWRSVLHPDDRLAAEERIFDAVRDHTQLSSEYRIIKPPGEERWIGALGNAVYDTQGEPLRMTGICLDITERKRAEADLRLAAAAFETQEGIMITDAHGVIERVNKAFTQITGYAADEVIGCSETLLHSGRHDAAFYATVWQDMLCTGAWQGEVWSRRKNGEEYAQWLSMTVVRDDNAAIVHSVCTMLDISQRRLREAEVAQLAFYDPLTGLANRRLMKDRLHQALAVSARTEREGALMFIDLDRFKSINDTLGHDKGDLLLQQVAQRLSSCVREGDTVARPGGDEFVVMLAADLSKAADEAAVQARVVGEKILTALNQPYDVAGDEYHGSASIGVALFGSQRIPMDELLKRADQAMYQAKAAGRNTLRFFDSAIQQSLQMRSTLEAGLHQAVQRGDFVLHFQPGFDRAGRLLGAEALVRWQHPRHGLILPDDFINIAEETGLIVSLGRWVLEAACAQLAAWSTEPEMARLFLSVNISARQLHDKRFVRNVLEAVERSGADATRLKLELTESMMLDDVGDTIAKLKDLKARGVGFSLDDFGTGYASLTYLKRLPLDQLKIDRSFVEDMLTSPRDAAIARAVVELGRSLGLTVIAEGVETWSQRDLLADYGCQVFQGNLFGLPAPMETLRQQARRFSGGAQAGPSPSAPTDRA
jgi:diguanylate cyclase (GGDEF)-like protein/PAS domain S-box-containing protein